VVLSNETVLIEQYANDRGPGRGSKGKAPLKLKLLDVQWKPQIFVCFLIFGDTKNHSYLRSALSKIIFPDFSKIIVFPDTSLTTQIS